MGSGGGGGCIAVVMGGQSAGTAGAFSLGRRRIGRAVVALVMVMMLVVMVVVVMSATDARCGGVGFAAVIVGHRDDCGNGGAENLISYNSDLRCCMYVDTEAPPPEMYVYVCAFSV